MKVKTVLQKLRKKKKKKKRKRVENPTDY